VGLVAIAVGGAAAGAIATAAMDLLWYRRYRDDDGDENFLAWEFSTSATDFGEDAPAPARVGKRIADAVGVSLSGSDVAATNNVVHWLTGIGWGQTAALATAVLPVPRFAVGLATGATAWRTSYALLGKLGIYKPIREYDKATLWKDLSAHLVFGAAIGLVLTAIR
jgi:hypothetical protein